MKTKPCRCAAYPFPHRPDSGACPGGESICPRCGVACSGLFEFREGARFALVSECCGVRV